MNELMEKLGSLCGPDPSYHWMDIVGVQDRVVSHSWHQDTGRSSAPTLVERWFGKISSSERLPRMRCLFSLDPVAGRVIGTIVSSLVLTRVFFLLARHKWMNNTLFDQSLKSLVLRQSQQAYNG
mmetsp:Transcript_4685/g.7182  ORF Transcript_4685/g.7182 Transcript_4685/m.7182 type:complete len:124 (-) Transcript_4685:8-379(-)